ncbi:outer membrane lipoprotein carrier protein LolA [Paenibacillus sp. SYP-B3998]|uniref:Outer membrane lipoprotein carrier protein LolA n=1 Tax=Paenibacillus sp. SYP-B3998 TaxID=2678564 RepID=A0A6G3ZZV1_9BACL|nr:outer membrane lipoprotein carrier protein LolA [Paenibacillus sp. SYP-B3998]NEW07101.1 outer membrane lipoprotein carrier protein LolA [Paenibacillus sp. SYP-B3998]
MRRVTWMIAIMMCLAVVLAGCGIGKKDAGSIVKDLDHVISKSGSYQASGSMILHTGQQPQEYQVEVAFSPDHFYRISLTNAQKDVTQIVLRNEEGVFVLTPHLKKSFRFQSDWPENQGQVYLFQSLAKSIVADKERQFTTENDAYVFDVAANYQNEMLSRQKIWLNKKTLAPTQVKVSDANQNVMVQVNFTKFEFDAKFDKDYFQMERNMTSWNMQTLPTTAGVNASDTDHNATNSKSLTDKNLSATGGQSDQIAGQTGKIGQDQSSAGTKSTTDSKQAANTKSVTDGKQATDTKLATDSKPTIDIKSNSAASKPQNIGIIEPSYLPKDVVKQDITDMKLGEDPAVLLRYKGKYNYSLIEVRPQAKAVSLQPGTIVDLGYTLAVLTGDEKKTLTWTNDGVEFRLSTGDLPTIEMMKIAMTTQGQSGK